MLGACGGDETVPVPGGVDAGAADGAGYGDSMVLRTFACQQFASNYCGARAGDPCNVPNIGCDMPTLDACLAGCEEDVTVLTQQWSDCVTTWSTWQDAGCPEPVADFWPACAWAVTGCE